MVILCGYALSLSVSLSLSLSFGTVYLLKYLSCRFRCLFFRIAVHLSVVHHLFVSLSHHSLHCVFFTVCPVLQFGLEVPFTEKTRESCYKVEWCVLPYLWTILSLMCRWFHWRALYLFYLHQFYYKKGSWFICMLFRWAFPLTKGSYSCTWLAPKGISCVGVYLVCLPWFKKSCFKSETVFLHFFSMWYLDPASLSVVSSLCLIL